VEVVLVAEYLEGPELAVREAVRLVRTAKKHQDFQAIRPFP
jgi:hypothetical protein